MKITIKSLKFDASEKLTAFVEKKVSRLERFCEGKDGEITVTLENNKEGKSCKLQVQLPGGGLQVIERTTDTFENGVTAAVDAMKEKLTRASERRQEADN